MKKIMVIVLFALAGTSLKIESINSNQAHSLSTAATLSARDRKIKNFVDTIITKEHLKKAFNSCLPEFIAQVKSICKNDEDKITYLISKLSSFDDQLEAGVPMIRQEFIQKISKSLANIKDEQLNFNLTTEKIMQVNTEFIQGMFKSVIEAVKQGKDPFLRTETITETTQKGTKVTVAVTEFGKKRVVSVNETKK